MRKIFKCPKESFPTGIFELTEGKKILPRKTSWVKDKNIEVCDLKLWYRRQGKGWYSDHPKIRKLIYVEYNGILNTQKKKNIILGNKMYQYGLTPKIVRKHLYLVY